MPIGGAVLTKPRYYTRRRDWSALADRASKAVIVVCGVYVLALLARAIEIAVTGVW